MVGERKYLGSGFDTKMSDNEDPFPVLGDAEIPAVKHLPFDAIPQLNKRGDDGLESSSVVMRKKPFDVFQYKVERASRIKNPSDVKKERASRVCKSFAKTCNTKRLAREAPDEEVEVGKSFSVDFCDVSPVLMFGEMSLIDLDGVFIDFGVADTMNCPLCPLVGRQNASSFFHSGPLPPLLYLRLGRSGLRVCALSTQSSFEPKLESSDAAEGGEVLEGSLGIHIQFTKNG
jgi:hypothetical protein